MPKPIVIADESIEDALILESTLRKKGVANTVQKLRDSATTLAYLEGSGPFADRARYPLPSILFLDLATAGRDAYAVLRWLESHTLQPRPRIILCAQAAELADLQHCRKLGADSFLLKEGLEQQLKKLLFQFPDEWEFGDPAQG